MKTSGDERRSFTATLLSVMALAALLVLVVFGMVYGCMKNNHASPNRPHEKAVQELFKDFVLPASFLTGRMQVKTPPGCCAS
jgi:hypothetical protein